MITQCYDYIGINILENSFVEVRVGNRKEKFLHGVLEIAKDTHPVTQLEGFRVDLGVEFLLWADCTVDIKCRNHAPINVDFPYEGYVKRVRFEYQIYIDPEDL